MIARPTRATRGQALATGEITAALCSGAALSHLAAGSHRQMAEALEIC